MDDLQLLRAMRSNVGTAPQATLDRGRNQLVSSISAGPRSSGTRSSGTRSSGTRSSGTTLSGTTSSGKTLSGPARTGQPRPRRTLKRVVFSVAAAAALVGAIVVADVVAPGGPAGATAEAAEVLNNAAEATIRTSDPVVNPGQFLLVDTQAIGPTARVFPDGSTASWLDRSGSQLYVPADRTGEWVLNRQARVQHEAFTDAGRAELDRIQASGGRSPASAEVLRGDGGAFSGSETIVLDMALTEAVATLPRDPQALLDVIYDRARGSGPSPGAVAMSAIAELLGTGIIPADLRAALYQAAVLIPDVRVVDTAATLDGRTGVAIGIETPGARADIIIDPATGLMIGERSVTLAGTADFPPGTAVAWTSVQTSVVDSAP